MDNVAKLAEKLYGPNGIGATNIKFSRGSRRDVTANEYAGEILQSIERIERGEVDEVDLSKLDD
jgi:hypothetical protein